MKFTTISDVHIKNPNDCPNHKLFLKYLDSKEVQQADKIFLLGDIFDIMVGNHKSYLILYKDIFNKLKNLSLAGKEICYIEGNHDFHIVALINYFTSENNLKKFQASAIPVHIKDKENGKSIYLGHGDEIEIENPSYQMLRFVLRSWPLKFIIYYLLNFHFLIWLGKKSSQASRNRNDKKYKKAFPEEMIKDRFRRSAEQLYSKGKFDILICGHSHVKDNYTFRDKFHYVNNGYFPIEKQFISYEGGRVSFVNI